MRSRAVCLNVQLMCCAVLLVAPMAAQQTPAPAAAPAQPPAVETPESARPMYLLSPNDQVIIRAQNVEEISERPFRIDTDGYLNLPIVGRVRAAGLTVEQLEALLVDRLKIFIQNPQVVVSVIETARQAEVQNPVFLVGAFKVPGVYGLGSRTENLSEILMKTGGLQPTANRKIRISRRIEQGPLNLPNPSESSDGKTTYAEVLLTTTGELANPAEDIEMKPFDALVATKAEPIYVTGEVGRGGPIPLEDREFMTATQVLSMVGVGPTSDIAKARILRPVHDGAQRAEIPVDLAAVMQGRANDFPLMANDVLFIPRKKTGTREFFSRLGFVAVPAVITSVIWILIRRR
jgi:polysaccharide biosynthesis/export protein